MKFLGKKREKKAMSMRNNPIMVDMVDARHRIRKMK